METLIFSTMVYSHHYSVLLVVLKPLHTVTG